MDVKKITETCRSLFSSPTVTVTRDCWPEHSLHLHGWWLLKIWATSLPRPRLYRHSLLQIHQGILSLITSSQNYDDRWMLHEGLG
jgi:hypothetical protein